MGKGHKNKNNNNNDQQKKKDRGCGKQNFSKHGASFATIT
jgi:hypothetical protein